MANFASLFCRHASGVLAQSLSCGPALSARRTAGQFLASIESPSCCFALKALAADSGEAKSATPGGWVEIAPGIALAMVNLLLGGPQSTAPIPVRPLTDIERRLLLRVVQTAAMAMAQTWPNVLPLWAPVEMPVLQSSDAPDRPAAIIMFELSLQGQVGALRLCVPPPDSVPASQQNSFSASQPRAQSPLLISIATPEVDVSAIDLARLAPGDIVTTEADANGEVIVRVAGIPKFAARLGSCSGRRAITITRKL